MQGKIIAEVDGVTMLQIYTYSFKMWYQLHIYNHVNTEL